MEPERSSLFLQVGSGQFHEAQLRSSLKLFGHSTSAGTSLSNTSCIAHGRLHEINDVAKQSPSLRSCHCLMLAANSPTKPSNTSPRVISWLIRFQLTTVSQPAAHLLLYCPLSCWSIPTSWPESAGFSSLAAPGRPEVRHCWHLQGQTPSRACEQSHHFVQFELFLHLLAFQTEHHLRETRALVNLQSTPSYLDQGMVVPGSSIQQFVFLEEATANHDEKQPLDIS